jgi:hypothetical protein
MLSFYCSSSGSVNSKRAIAECLEIALEGQGSLDCDLLIIHSSIGHNFEEMLSEAHRLAPSAQVVGCTGAGVIGREGPNESMKALAIMAIKGDKDEFAIAGSERITFATSFDVGAQLARDLRDASPNINMIHFMPSGYDVAAETALEGIESVFGPEVPIFGATSSDNVRLASPFQFMRDRIFERGAVAVGFADPTLEVITQATHGFNLMGDPFEVTRSELNRIFEIEGQPAWKFLTSRMGVPETSTLLESMHAGALARELPAELQREYGNTHILSGCLFVNEDGSTLSPAIHPAGTKLWHAMRDEERMFKDLDEMVNQLVDRCQGRTPVAVFHADCSYRGRLSFNTILKDEIIRRMQYPIVQDADVPWVGMYGLGEFARLGGRNRFHMLTTSLYLVFRKEE